MPDTYTATLGLTKPDVDGLADVAELNTNFDLIDTAIKALTGAPALAGPLTLVGALTFSAGASKIVPGATSFSIRNNADTADNLLVSNAGAVTIPGAINGQTISATAAFTGTVSVAGVLTMTANPVLNRTGTSFLTIKDAGTNKAFIGYASGASSIVGSDAANDLVVVSLAGRIVLAPVNNISALVTATGMTLGNAVSARSATEPTNAVTLYNGTAPSGTRTNGVDLYASAGELRCMDAAGNSTLLSPHDQRTNEWIFWSKNTVTGQVLRIDMERLMRRLDQAFGGGFVREFVEAT